MRTLPNLTPLRFFLAVLVILFHVPALCRNQGLPYYDNSPVFHRGVEAVYLFFSLSGYLIIRQIYITRMAGKFDIKQFYWRRARRILPLYFIVSIFGLTFYHLILPLIGIPFENKYELWTGILLLAGFLPNIFLTYEPGGILEILWSIGIEEQFYLLIPSILLLIHPRRSILFLSILSVGYFLLFQTDPTGLLQQYKLVYFYMLFGGVMGIIAETYPCKFLKNSPTALLIIVGAVGLIFFSDSFTWSPDWLYHFILTVSFSLFLFVISEHSHINNINSPLLNHLGKISYGLYMYHVIALNAVVFAFLKLPVLGHLPSWMIVVLVNVLTIALTIVVAQISYKYVESHFLNRPSN